MKSMELRISEIRGTKRVGVTHPWYAGVFPAPGTGSGMRTLRAARGAPSPRVHDVPLMESDTKGQDMTGSGSSERTTGGLAGKVAGKAKEVVGETTDNEQLAREGRLQQEQVDAARDAERERREATRAEQEAQLEREKAESRREREEIAAEVEQREAEEAAERDRKAAEQRAQRQASEEVRDAKAAERTEEAIAEQRERRAEAE